MARRIVITGIGAVSALGLDTAAFWENLCAGRSGIGPLEGFTGNGGKGVLDYGGEI